MDRHLVTDCCWAPPGLLPLASFAVICIGYSVRRCRHARAYRRRSTPATSSIGAIVARLRAQHDRACSASGCRTIRSTPAHHARRRRSEHAAQDMRRAEAAHDVAVPARPSCRPKSAAERRTQHADEHNDDAAAVLSPATGTRSASSASCKLTIGYYIDTLTVTMFCMVTLIASCIHFYAIGYMHDELHDVTDHEVTLADGHHLHRPGRFHRFFQYLSLFCFSMLGIVHRRQPGDGVRVLGAGGHLLVFPDRLLHRAARAPARPRTRRSSSTASATSACSSA